jgi:hypothetical protein
MGYTIVFCLPGSTFSKEFLQAWSDLIFNLVCLGHQVKLSCAYDANVYYSRARCLCTETLKGLNQKPFDGKLDYDYLFWIDSDVLFTSDQVLKLIAHDKDIVSGAYVMHDNNHYPIVVDMDNDFYLKNGHYEFLSRDQLKPLTEKGELFEAAYVGFGFMCVKKGVFEALTYPYFYPVQVTFGTDYLNEFASEDVSWCVHVRNKGYKVFVDPTIIVAHQKLIPLR